MEASLGAPDADRRSAQRARTLKRAQIIFNKGYGVFDCAVRNLSAGGALLDVPSMLGIPPRFEVVIDGVRHPCTVRWHTDQLMGVQFDDTGLTAA